MGNYRSGANYQKGGKRKVSEKLKFYKSLRAYMIFHIFMFGMIFSGFAGIGFWPVTFFWGLGLAVHYIKAFGLPGTHGWFSEEWEEWMKEREEQRPGRPVEDRLELEEWEPVEEKRTWRENDLV